MLTLEERAEHHGEDTELGEACSAAWREMSQYYVDSDTKSYLATATILDPRYRFEVIDNLEWTQEEKAAAVECFEQQFRMYEARYVEELAEQARKAEELAGQGNKHLLPSSNPTATVQASTRRNLAHNDEDYVTLLSTGLFFIEEDPSPDAEIASYQAERRQPPTANPLDFWRLNVTRYPVLARMVCTFSCSDDWYLKL
jgi:hypothetical protein